MNSSRHNNQLQYLISIAKSNIDKTKALPFCKYLDELKVNGIRESTLEYYNSILRDAHDFKPLPDWNREDVNAYILSLQERNKQSSIETKKLVLKKYLTWAGRKESVAHLRSRIIQNDLQRDELLTPEDIDKMISATESPLWKALISILWETGARIGEVLALHVSDIQETDGGLIVNIHTTKTDVGYRRNLLIYSMQYIRNHISYSNLRKDDLLFSVTGCWVWIQLNRIKDAAGIGKPVSAHKFRHAAATYAVLKGYHEDIIRKKFGWSPTSTVPARYKHIVDDDVLFQTAEIEGKDAVPKQNIISNIQRAEPLSIADTAAVIQKLADENELMKRQFQAMADAFGFEIRPDGSFYFNATLKSLPDKYRKKSKGKELVLIRTDKLDESNNP